MEQVTYKKSDSLLKVMIVVIGAAVYGAGLWVTSAFPLIPGVTWARPANILSEILGVCTGWAGAWASMLGNTLGDTLRGSPPTLLNFWWLLPLQFFCTAGVVYLGVTDPSLRSWRGKIEWIVYAILLQGFLTGYGIGFFLALQGVVPWSKFTVIGKTIFFNEALPAIPAGFVQYFLFPLLVKAGLWWGKDLDKSNVPKKYLTELRR